MVAASRNASLSSTAAATRAKKLPRPAHRVAEAVSLWMLRREDGSAESRGRQVRGSRSQKTRICRYTGDRPVSGDERAGPGRARVRRLGAKVIDSLRIADGAAICANSVAAGPGLDPLHRIAQVVLLDDVVSVEDGPGAVPRHPHHHRLRHSTPACVGDEAAPQVVEPDARELHRLACAAKHLADVFPRLLGLRIGKDPVALDVPRLGLERFPQPQAADQRAGASTTPMVAIMPLSSCSRM